MTPHTYLAGLARRWWLALLVVVLCAGAALAATATQPATYTAQAQLYFGTVYGRTATDLSQGTTFVQEHVTTFAALADTQAVLEPTISGLGLSQSVKDLSDNVSASASRDTVIVTVSATARTAQGAADLANAVAKNLGKAAQDVSPKDASGATTLLASLVAPAQVPTARSGPAVTRTVLAAGVAGVLLALVVELVVGLVTRRRHSAPAGSRRAVATDGTEEREPTGPVSPAVTSRTMTSSGTGTAGPAA